MNKIEKLIKEFCPDGVEWKKLGEVCLEKFWIMPATPRFVDKGIPYITGKNIKNGEIDYKNVKYISKEIYDLIAQNRNIRSGDILVSMIGTIGEIGIVRENIDFYGQNLYLLRLNKDFILNRYFFHYFTQIHIKDKLISKKNSSSQGYIRAGQLEELKIPIPSIETQEKIVKILDNFTKYVTELQVELQARNKQYNCYRDMLLSEDYLNKIFKKIYEIEENRTLALVPIKEVCIRQRGFNITAAKMKETHKENALIKIFAGGKTVANIDESDIDKKYIIEKPSIIVKSRGNIDFEFYDKPFSHKNELWSYSSKNNDILNIKYLYYYLKKNIKYFEDKSISGKLPQISTGVTDNYKVFIPSIIIQNKIVKILDRFQELLSDTKGLLPLEIEQRRKQYEYYREKLLTFDKEERYALSTAQHSTAQHSTAQHSTAQHSTAQHSRK